MKLVIEIPEEDYNFVKKQVADGITNPLKMRIAKGTPLPKGHGRLIDADTLEECKEVMNTIMNESEYAVRMDEVRNVPTIIEADGGEG